MDELLRIENLAVEYQSERAVAKALNGINLTIGKGESFSWGSTSFQKCSERNIASVGKSTHARRTFRPAFRYVIVLNLHQQDCILCLTKNAPERPVSLRVFPEHGRQMARQTRQMG